MNNQLELIHQNSTWLHFIGGYYKDEQQFVREARKQGITRRIPAQVVRGMEFGDRIVFLRYVKGNSAFAFAEGQIIGLTLDGPIARQVGERLIEAGKATYEEGGGMVQRECGSYFVIGTYSVNATLKETMDIAQEIHAKQAQEEGQEPDPLFVMVNARLITAYDDPVYLSPSPRFTRGFIRSDDASFVAPANHMPERKVVAIDGYAKKRHPRQGIDVPLLPDLG